MILPYGSHCIDMTVSPEPALWRHDHNVGDQNMVVLPFVGGRLTMFTEEYSPSKYNVDDMSSM